MADNDRTKESIKKVLEGLLNLISDEDVNIEGGLYKIDDGFELKGFPIKYYFRCKKQRIELIVNLYQESLNE